MFADVGIVLLTFSTAAREELQYPKAVLTLFFYEKERK